MLAELQAKAQEGIAPEGDADEETKLALFYNAAMDEAAVEAAGIAPLAPALELCAAAKEPEQRVASLGQLYAQ